MNNTYCGHSSPWALHRNDFLQFLKGLDLKEMHDEGLTKTLFEPLAKMLYNKENPRNSSIIKGLIVVACDPKGTQNPTILYQNQYDAWVNLTPSSVAQAFIEKNLQKVIDFANSFDLYLAEVKDDMGVSIKDMIHETKWFTYITGVDEKMLFEKKIQIFQKDDKTVYIINNTNQNRLKCGSYHVLSFAQMTKLQPLNVGQRKHVPFCIVTSAEPDKKMVDIFRLQSDRHFHGDTFQLASNFNGLESICETSDPFTDPKFVTNYIMDKTQGPIGSISAGPGAIARRYYFPIQSFLQDLPNLPTQNGYIMVKPATPATSEEEILEKLKIGLHINQEVVFQKWDMKAQQMTAAPSDQRNTIHQVFTAAMNVGQGTSGQMNWNVMKTREQQPECVSLLQGSYRNTYMAAHLAQSKALHLTLVGGGVFSPTQDDTNIEEYMSSLFQAICAAHVDVGDYSNLERVYLRLYDMSQLKNLKLSLALALDDGEHEVLHCHYDKNGNKTLKTLGGDDVKDYRIKVFA